MTGRSSIKSTSDSYSPPCRVAGFLLLLALTAGSAGAEGRFELLSRTLMQNPARTAAIMDGKVILGSGGGIAVYDCGNGFSRESFLPTGGEPLDIVIRNGIAYIAAYRGGLSIVDLSDPKHPVERNRIQTPDARFIAFAGERLLMGDDKRGMLLYDITSPLEPRLMETVKGRTQLVGLAAESNMIAALSPRIVQIYMLDDEVGLWIATELTTDVFLKRCLLHERVLYLLTVQGDVLRTDLGNPIVPEELDALPVSGIVDMHIYSDELLLLTSEGGIISFDISDGAAGRPLEIKGGPKISSGSWFERLKANLFGKSVVIGDRIFFGGDLIAAISYKEGLSVYTRSNETARFVGSENPVGFAIDLVVHDGTLYLGNNFGGLMVGRVGDDGSIEWVKRVQTDEARDVAISGDVLILADGKFGLKLFDVSDPVDPKRIGSHSSYFFQSAVVTNRDMAYVAGGIGGAEIVDISNPRLPKLIWRRELSEVRGVHVDDDYLYLPDGNDGFRIYSLEKKTPEELAVLDTEGWNCDCFVIGDMAYLADGGHGIKVVDISDRSNPRLRGSIDLGTIAREIHAVPGTVFVAAHTRGIMAIDVEDPENPVIAAHYQTVDDARGVYTDGRFVYLASGSGGVYIFRYIED